MTENELKLLNTKNAECQATNKAQLTEKELKLLNTKNAQCQAKLKANLTTEELNSMKNKNLSSKKEKPKEYYIEKYHQFINETCTHICTSCGNIWFSSSVTCYKVEDFKSKIMEKYPKENLLGVIQFIVDYTDFNLRVSGNICLCTTCNKYIKKLKVIYF